MNKKIKSTAYTGILASLIMFAGDMLLYYTSQPSLDFENELFTIMGEIPFWRLAIGGLLGPLAAFLYIMGYYHISYAFKKPQGKMSMTILTIFSISIIFGGAFHAFFPAFGIASSGANSELLDTLLKYAELLGTATFFLMLIGWILVIIAILRKQTRYPQAMILATPIVLFWLLYVWQQLPQPLHIILAGGWNNLVMTVFFTVSMLVLGKKKKAKK